jgi:hypothetical protein
MIAYIAPKPSLGEAKTAKEKRAQVLGNKASREIGRFRA